MNIFEQATRKQLRFRLGSTVFTVEDLWQLPLSSNGDRDLTTLAVNIHKELQAAIGGGELSWLGPKEHLSPATKDHDLRLQIIKHIVETRRADAEKAQQEEAKRQLLARLKVEKARRKDQELTEQSDEELDKLIAELEQ